MLMIRGVGERGIVGDVTSGSVSVFVYSLVSAIHTFIVGVYLLQTRAPITGPTGKLSVRCPGLDCLDNGRMGGVLTYGYDMLCMLNDQRKSPAGLRPTLGKR